MKCGPAPRRTASAYFIEPDSIWTLLSDGSVIPAKRFDEVPFFLAGLMNVPPRANGATFSAQSFGTRSGS